MSRKKAQQSAEDRKAAFRRLGSGNWISEFLAERSWTYDDLEAKSGVDRTTLSRIVNGSTDTRMATAFRISDAFGLSITEVFYRISE